MSLDEEIEIGRGRSGNDASDKIPSGLLHDGKSHGHYHLELKPGRRSNGASAKAHADYIAREGRYGDEERASDLEHVEHGNMPEWAKERPAAFWEAADTYERGNARLYSELEISLPRQLSPGQRMELIQGFMAEHIGDRHPYTLAVHNPTALDGLEQPHAHLMFTERKLDGIKRGPDQFFKRKDPKHPERGGTPKDRDWNRRSKVLELRESWANHANQALEKAGLDIRVSHLSLKEQGIDRMPEPKLGPSTSAMLKKGKASKFATAVLELREINKAIQEEKRKIAAEVGHRAPPIEKAHDAGKPEAERPTLPPEKAATATNPEIEHRAPLHADLADRVQQLIQEGEKLAEQAKIKTRGMKVKERREHGNKQADQAAQYMKRVEAVKHDVRAMPKGEARTALLDSLKVSSRISKKLDRGKGFER